MQNTESPAPRTSAATAARRSIGDQKAATRLTDAGYTVVPPGQEEELAGVLKAAGWLVFPPDTAPILDERANWSGPELEEDSPEYALALAEWLLVNPSGRQRFLDAIAADPETAAVESRS